MGSFLATGQYELAQAQIVTKGYIGRKNYHYSLGNHGATVPIRTEPLSLKQIRLWLEGTLVPGPCP